MSFPPIIPRSKPIDIPKSLNIPKSDIFEKPKPLHRCKKYSDLTKSMTEQEYKTLMVQIALEDKKHGN